MHFNLFFSILPKYLKPKSQMLTTITIFISALVVLNFLLLKFSSNKTAQRKSPERPFVIKTKTKVITTPQLSNQLAPTGS